MSGKLVIAILAAGSARRFGGGKLDADLAGKAVGRYALDAALALGRAVPVIVVGDPAPRFAGDAALRGEAVLLANSRAQDGLGTSVALAARHASESGASALLLLAADMPLVTLPTLAALVGDPARLAAVRYPNGRGGIPACFPADHFAALAALAGEKGAAALLGDAALIDVATGELNDVDTTAELESIRTMLDKTL